jgi:hypothetical protein
MPAYLYPDPPTPAPRIPQPRRLAPLPPIASADPFEAQMLTQVQEQDRRQATREETERRQAETLAATQPKLSPGQEAVLRSLAEGARQRVAEKNRLAEEAAFSALMRRIDAEAAKVDALMGPGWLAKKTGSAPTDPGWKATDVDSLTDAQVLAFSVTGQWRVFAPTVRLAWKSEPRHHVAEQAKTAASDIKAIADTVRGPSHPAPAAAPPAGGQSDFLKALLIAHEPSIDLPSLNDFLSVATDVLGSTAIGAIMSIIPFLSTIHAGFTAAGAAVKALRLHIARSDASSAGAFLRPGTPEAASAAYIDALAYFRNSKSATAATATAQMVASIFDLGLASGPVTSLANVAISVHGLYHAWKEKSSYEGLVTTDPYGALMNCGTMGAFVMFNYPAIGLIDPRRVTSADTVAATGKGLLARFRSAPKSPIFETITKIRKAAKLALDNSLLKVEMVP